MVERRFLINIQRNVKDFEKKSNCTCTIKLRVGNLAVAAFEHVAVPNEAHHLKFTQIDFFFGFEIFLSNFNF